MNFTKRQDLKLAAGLDVEGCASGKPKPVGPPGVCCTCWCGLPVWRGVWGVNASGRIGKGLTATVYGGGAEAGPGDCCTCQCGLPACGWWWWGGAWGCAAAADACSRGREVGQAWGREVGQAWGRAACAYVNSGGGAGSGLGRALCMRVQLLKSAWSCAHERLCSFGGGAFAGSG
eukprot:357485-Chlamydomonas_euryale.AAC.3